MFAFIQEPLSEIDWLKEGGLAAVAFILLVVAGWFLGMYLRERKCLNDANKEHLKTYVKISTQYAQDYKELLERLLLSDHIGNEALDKLRAAVDVAGKLEAITKNVAYLRDRGGDE